MNNHHMTKETDMETILHRIHPIDNIAVTLREIAPGETWFGVTAVVCIPAGHKMALSAIASGDRIVKYGYPIGRATEAIPPGGWVHSHNCRTCLEASVRYVYEPRPASRAAETPDTFYGYRRGEGRAGIRTRYGLFPLWAA